MLVDARFVNLSFIRGEQEVPYWRRFQDAIDAKTEAEKGIPQLQCWFFDKPYTNKYLLQGRLHRKRMLEIKHWQSNAVHNPLLAGWHHVEQFAVRPRERHCYKIQVMPFWREWKTLRMLCVPTTLMLAYYSGA